MPSEEQIVLVDEYDAQVGVLGKMETHKKGLLHRAFSIFIHNENGELLLQRRAPGKYHSGGLWTNTCCGHPRDGEKLTAAAHRRLTEEMGFDCPLTELFVFTYHAFLNKGLIENEIDHVFIGVFNGEPVVNLQEASDWKWTSKNNIKDDVLKNPDRYTYWFKAALANWPRTAGK